MSKAIPSVSIELDKERHMRLPFNAIIEFEKMTGKKITEMDEKNMSMENIRALIFVALKGEDKDLTVEQVGDMLHFGNIGDVTKKINLLFEVSMPEKEEGGNPKPKPQAG